MNYLNNNIKLTVAAFTLIVIAILSGCGAGGGGSGGSTSSDWYYHWNCNGDSQCLALGPGAINQASGTLNEGPVYAMCSPLLIFASKNWNMPPATNSCDQSPTVGGGGTSATATISAFTPTSGAPGSAVTITGTNFPTSTSQISVTINGVTAKVTSVTSTQVVITIPVMPIYTGPITVITSSGSVVSSTNFSVTVASGTTNNLNGIACSTTLCVAVGDAGTILTSPDGATWTSRTSGNLNNLYGIAWSGSQFISVGLSGTVLTSSNGTTWATQTSGTSNTLSGIACSTTQCAVVGNLIILTSPPADGITWTARTPTGAGNLSFSTATWSGSTFVAAGAGGVDFATSTDGLIWSSQILTSSGTTNNIYGVTWSGTQFVAVGGNSTSLGYVATSPDGITWTPQTSGATMGFFGIASSGTKLLAVGYVSYGASNMYSSTNGVTWTAQTSGISNPLFGVAWFGTKFVVVGGSGVIFTTP